jgi:eukaryotic-like serine/threonine-protein kinase
MLKRGTRLGPYEVLSLVGTGGMGEVYCARDPRLHRDVAIKVVATAPDAQHLRRFEQEARAAAGLSHPNILAIYDVGTHEEQPFVVSELLVGETLRDKLSRSALPLKRAIDYAHQIASGLAAAHAGGIVHRDLKPANLFVTTDGRVKILDFGLAVLVPSGQSLGEASTVSTGPEAGVGGAIAGTPSYMSPEQILVRQIDHRSDIFSFGLVLYEMLTGRRAFDRASPIQTMSAALDQEPAALTSLLPTVPAEIQLIVARCLEKNPDDRFQSTRDLCFSMILASQAADAGVQERSPVASRRSRLLVATALALAVAGAFGLGFVGGTSIAPVPPPQYQQLTFRRGAVGSARFAADGHTIVYGAAWDGATRRLWSTRPESPESLQLPIANADILSISGSGEMAVLLARRSAVGIGSGGILARLPLNASAPREVLTGVEGADWAPDGHDFAVVHVVDGKYRLEFPIGTVLYEAGTRLSDVRVSPDGTRVAFVDRPLFEADDRGAVCVIGKAERTKRVLSEGWSSVTGLAWAPAGNEIWFTAAASGTAASLYAVDLSGQARTVASSPRRMTIQDIHRDGRVLLTEGSFRLRIGGARTPLGNEQDLSWLDASVLTDVSADGSTLLINEQGAGGGTPLYAVYVRKTDGSPAVRIGDGSSPALSPDGRWAAALVLRSPPSILLLPTGVGQPRTFRPGTIRDYQAVTWFPDGRRLLVAGSEAGRGVRLWTVDVQDGTRKEVSEEGLRIASFGRPISPDGTRVAALDGSGRLWLSSMNGTRPSRPVDGLEPGYLPISWHTDGRSIYVFRDGELPAIIYRFHVDDGRKEQVAELAPPDAAGVKAPATIVATADGRRFFYSYVQSLSDLFLVDTLR